MEERIDELEAYVLVLEDVIVNIMQKLVNFIGLDLARELVREIEAARPKQKK